MTFLQKLYRDIVHVIKLFLALSRWQVFLEPVPIHKGVHTVFVYSSSMRSELVLLGKVICVFMRGYSSDMETGQIQQLHRLSFLLLNCWFVRTLSHITSCYTTKTPESNNRALSLHISASAIEYTITESGLSK